MGKQKVFESRLQDLSDQLELAERYAIVGLGSFFFGNNLDIATHDSIGRLTTFSGRL